MGDDSDFYVPKFISTDMISSKLTELSKIAKHHIKMYLHPLKQKIQESNLSRSFIGYQFRNGHLYRDTKEWFCMLLYPEANVKDLTISWSRILGFTVVGCLTDPEVFRFVNFYQSCYDLRNINGYELREQRYFNTVFEIQLDYESINVYKMQTAIFKRQPSKYRTG